MDPQRDELTDRLSAELRRRATSTDGAWLNLSDVRKRARSIRRRRRAVVGAGVVAAMAVIAPLATNIVDPPEVKRERESTAASTPTRPVRSVVELEDTQRGPAPDVEYFSADGLVLPDGTRRVLDTSWQAAVSSEADGGWLALGPSGDVLVSLTEDFEPVSTRPISQTLVSNPDRTAVAYTLVDGDTQALTVHSTIDGSDDVTWTFAASPVVDPVDFTGPESLLFQTTRQDGRHGIGIANPDGTKTLLEGTYIKAISADPITGRIAVQTKSRPDLSSCSAVIEPAGTETPIWDTCEYLLGGFSPDGRFLIASDPIQSGAGPTSLSVLNAASGDLVASFEPARPGRLTFPSGFVWETADTILAVANAGNSTTILRLRLSDGGVEQVADAMAGDPLQDQPYYLGQDRRRGF